MYRMLIVDDEPEIVDSLFELFIEEDFPNIEVLKCYSSKDAVHTVNTNRIDILLTDIRMPAINGIQLAEITRNNWPKCRIIFLSGYNEFEYAYTAIKKDCEDYILKTESNREILKSVKNVIEKMEQSFQDKALMDQVKEQMKQAAPLLRKELMLEIIKGIVTPADITQDKFDELEISLRADRKVMILFGGIDGNFISENNKVLEKEYMLAIKLILQEVLFRYKHKIIVEYDSKSFVCLIQEEAELRSPANNENRKMIENIALIKGAAETIQDICRESLEVTISLTLSSEAADWDQVSIKFMQLKKILDCSSSIGTEALLTDRSFSFGLFDRISSYNHDTLERTTANLQKIDTLVKYFESGMKREYFQLLSGILEGLRGEKRNNNNYALEIYYSVATCLLSYINRWKISDSIAFKIELHKLTRADEHHSWKDAVEYLFELSEAIFETQKKDRDQIADASIKYIQQYIQSHIHEQLTLTNLSEMVYLNSSYLSRLFKKVSGKNLSDYIIEAKVEKAKTLLEQSDIKIKDLTEMLSFESATYFGRIFKKFTDMTPKEYRKITQLSQLNAQKENS